MKIKIEERGTEIPVENGQTILDALKSVNIDIENPCRGLGTCGKCRVRIKEGNVSAISSKEKNLIGSFAEKEGIRLACSTFPQSDITVSLEKTEAEGKVMSSGYMPDFTHDEGREGLGVAVDIGTTTVAAELCDLSTGEVLSSSSMVNPQKKFGLDVLSRITHEVEEGEKGIRELQDEITVCLKDLTEKNLLSSGRNPQEIMEYVISANTTMMHMLLGKDASPMGRFPYDPSFEGAVTVPAESLGLPGGKEASVYCIPHVSAFIGADIVSGARVSEISQREGNVLFIDIGTNGEIVLKSGDRLSCCSCAAGPALEGMNISSGVRASRGAVEDLRITEDGVEIKTIDDDTPTGLCGSGILAAIRELLNSGIVLNNGAFIKKESLSESDPRYKMIGLDGKKREFIVSENPRITVTQGDVRQVQLAKGAILSGFIALLNKFSISMEDLGEVLIAGQFGAHLPPDSLTGTGILPPETKDKITYLGNTSMTGARMALLSHSARKEMEELKEKMEYVELAVTENYEDIFRQAMIYPDKGKR